MTVQACLENQIGRLVHPSVQGAPPAALRHLFFIAGSIVVSGLALAAAPLCLALGHVPTWPDALMLSWLVVPLIAAARVSNTGDLATGEVLAGVAWTGLAWTGVLSGACSPGVATALLILVLAAACTGDARGAVPITVTAGLSILILVMLGRLAPRSTAGGHADALLTGFALVQAGALVWRGRAVTRATDAAMRLEVQRYRTLSDAIGDLVLRFDGAGLVLGVGGAAERLFGLPASDLLGRGFFERVHVADRPAFLHSVHHAAAARDGATINLRFRLTSVSSADGTYAEPVFAWIEIRTQPLAAALPGEAAVVAAVRNISERKQHEVEVERAKREAEQANAAKDRFIATVSHELRTPLNSIIGFAEMLASPTLAPREPAKRQNYAEIIRTSGQHLLAVVNSLLDLSKLDAGKFELCCEPFDMGVLVEGCCEMVSLKAAENGITVRRDIQPGLEPLVGDRRACKQVLLNLLSNALKFTRTGGRITLSVRADGNALLVCVQDTGIGMAARDLTKLGDPFFQARGDYDRPFEGTGLGLSIVKGLVGLHGGTITVDSAPGEGTGVTVRLPLDGQRLQRSPSAKIEVITRYPRGVAIPSTPDHKVQKIA